MEIQRNHSFIQSRKDLPPQFVPFSSLSYVDEKFLQSYKATVGADFMEHEVIVDGKVICLEVKAVLRRSGILLARKSS